VIDGVENRRGNLAEDIGETTDLSDSMPEKKAALLSNLNNWREEVEAQTPTFNPDYVENSR